MALEVQTIPLEITEDTLLKNPEIVPQITMAENEDLLKKRQDGKNLFSRKKKSIFTDFFVKMFR